MKPMNTKHCGPDDINMMNDIHVEQFLSRCYEGDNSKLKVPFDGEN